MLLECTDADGFVTVDCCSGSTVFTAAGGAAIFSCRGAVSHHRWLLRREWRGFFCCRIHRYRRLVYFDRRRGRGNLRNWRWNRHSFPRFHGCWLGRICGLTFSILGRIVGTTFSALAVRRHGNFFRVWQILHPRRDNWRRNHGCWCLRSRRRRRWLLTASRGPISGDLVLSPSSFADADDKIEPARLLCLTGAGAIGFTGTFDTCGATAVVSILGSRTGLPSSPPPNQSTLERDQVVD